MTPLPSKRRAIKNPLECVFTAAEAAERWYLSVSTVRNACLAGRFLINEARKSGKTWLVTRAAMERLYGPRPDSRERE